MATLSPLLTDMEGYDPATVALVGFLRAEADLSEQRAESLRTQATNLAAQFGITEDLQQRYELDPDQLPPLDANGIPKYKGRKRGRKPKIRKRKSNPNRRKRQHTAYTLFVKEVYPSVKAQHSDFPNKEMISIVAKQWALVLPEDKLKWKARAQLTHDSADEDEEEEDEEEEEEEAEEDGKDKYGARALNLQAAVAAAATAAAVEAGFGQVDSYGVEGVEDDEEDDDEDEDDEPPPPRRQGHLPTKRK